MVHKIKIKVGNAEFEAEGSAEDVESQYTRFLALLDKAPSAKLTEKTLESNPEITTNNVANSDLSKLFELRQDGIVTLRMLPKGDDREADAFLLLLYGYLMLKEQEEVLATQLLAAADRSGLSAYRPAHALAIHDGLVRRGGVKKGSWYSLNNQGKLKAQEIAAKILE